MATTTHISILRGPQDASYTVTIRRPGAEGEIVYAASSDDVQEVEGGALEFSWDGLPLDTSGRFSGRLIWTGNAGDVVVESVNMYEPPLPVIDNQGRVTPVDLVDQELTVTRNASNQPVLSWVSDIHATAYKVMRSTDGVTYTQIAGVHPPTVTYTDTARPNAVNVFYSIVSVH